MALASESRDGFFEKPLRFAPVIHQSKGSSCSPRGRQPGSHRGRKKIRNKMSSWLKFSNSNLQTAASEQELEVYHLSERQLRNDSEHWSLHPDIHVVHADLFFQKTLQQMLKSERYWEKTVWVLPKMNFSHECEPHQIQNMDFIHTYPVLQRGDGDLQIWRHCPGILQLLSTGSCWSSVLDSQAIVVSLSVCCEGSLFIWSAECRALGMPV